jgi:hypothetical protein
MSYLETLEVLVDELEDKKPFLNKAEKELLCKYLKLLEEERKQVDLYFSQKILYNYKKLKVK